MTVRQLGKPFLSFFSFFFFLFLVYSFLKKKKKVDESLKSGHSQPSLTVPEPFHLIGEEISKSKKRKFQEELEKREAELKAQREFKAQPLPYGSPDVSCHTYNNLIIT